MCAVCCVCMCWYVFVVVVVIVVIGGLLVVDFFLCCVVSCGVVCVSVVKWWSVVFAKSVVSVLSYVALKQTTCNLILIDPSKEEGP